MLLKKWPKNQFPDLVTEINYCINRAFKVGLLTRKEVEYLRVEDYNIHTFYVTPKLHKNMGKPPGQQIVLGKRGLLERIGKYIDKCKRRLNRELPLFVSD